MFPSCIRQRTGVERVKRAKPAWSRELLQTSLSSFSTLPCYGAVFCFKSEKEKGRKSEPIEDVAQPGHIP